MRALRNGLILCALAGTVGSGEARAIDALEARTRSFKLITEGSQAYDAGRYADAVRMLEEATQISLNSFQGFYYLGLSYNAVRRYPDALAALAVALELEPGHLQSHIAVGDAHLKQGELREASVEYHRALELQAAYAAGYDGLARLAEAQGNDDEAERIYRQAIQSNPGFPEAYLHLGDLYLRAGKVSDAADLFLAAIRVRPDFAAAFNSLGAAYAAQGLYDEAMSALGKARVLRPLAAEHPLELGKVLLQIGLPDRAEKEILEAIRLDPDLLEPYLRLGELYRRARHYDDAVTVLEQGLQRPGDDPVMAGEIRKALERYRQERATLTALETRADAGELLGLDGALVLARLYSDLGDAARAAAVLGANLGPEGPTGESAAAVRFELAYYRLRAGDYVRAQEEFAALAQSDPSDTAALMNLGTAAVGQGKLGEAEAAYRRALDLNPRLADAYLYLGNVYVRSGKTKDAEIAYRQFLQVQERGDNVERVRRILELLAGNKG